MHIIVLLSFSVVLKSKAVSNHLTMDLINALISYFHLICFLMNTLVLHDCISKIKRTNRREVNIIVCMGLIRIKQSIEKVKISNLYVWFPSYNTVMLKTKTVTIFNSVYSVAKCFRHFNIIEVLPISTISPFDCSKFCLCLGFKSLYHTNLSDSDGNNHSTLGNMLILYKICIKLSAVLFCLFD